MITRTESRWVVYDKLSGKLCVRGNLWGLTPSPAEALSFTTEARAGAYIKNFYKTRAHMITCGYIVEDRDYYTVPVEITYTVMLGV